jgi:hypothetical protein
MQSGDSTSSLTGDIFADSSESTNSLPTEEQEHLVVPQKTQGPARKRWDVGHIVVATVGTLAALVAVLSVIYYVGVFVGSTNSDIETLTNTIKEDKETTDKRLSQVETAVTHLKDSQSRALQEAETRLHLEIGAVNARVDGLLSSKPPATQVGAPQRDHQSPP